jgi:hypothetical protein
MTELSYGFVRTTAETGVPTAVSDGSPVNLWVDEYGRQVIKGFNASVGALDTNEVAPWGTQRQQDVFARLTAPGSTAPVNMEVYHNLLLSVDVNSMAGGDTLTVRVEGSLDGTNWFNLDDAGLDTTYTGDGTYQFHKDNFACKYFRFTFVSETGGGAGTIDVDYILGN